MNPETKRTGLSRLWHALHYSLAGLSAAYRHEAAFRQELILAAILIPVALVLPVNGIGKAMLIASVIGVLVVELLNSAIESTVDRISPERHELAKRAKDMGSAAVLLGLVNLVATWLLVIFF